MSGEVETDWLLATSEGIRDGECVELETGSRATGRALTPTTAAAAACVAAGIPPAAAGEPV